MKINETKLEKKISPLNAISLAMGCIIGWGAFVMPGETFLINAGPMGTAIAMFLASIILIVIAFNYNYMINKFPMAGGGFKYAEQAFGKKHAFWCAWFLGLSYLTIVSLNATALALIGRNLMGSFFQIGFHYNFAGYDIYFGEILLAVLALIVLGIFSIKDVKFAGKFQNLLVFSLVSGVFIILVAAIIKTPNPIQSLQPYFSPQNSVAIGLFSIISIAPWAFVGFDTIPQSAEEFNFSPNKTKIIMIGSILFGALVYVLLTFIAAMVVPSTYANWFEYVKDIPNLNGIISLPVFYAAKSLLGNVGILFLFLSVLAAILSGIIGFYMASSRLLYAVSKSGFIPNFFSKIHKKYKTPYYAIIFVMIISCIGPFFGRTALGWIVDMSSIGASIAYIYTSAASLKFSLKEKNKFIIFTSFIGIFIGLFFTCILLIPFPFLNCSLGKESYICLFVWIVIGYVFYKNNKK